eukprot:Lithocolla_globosa_v1_NODE_214_length_5084_cov_10.333665.p2 type:complete len:185 gc:universal NODE_214_length_5084_cov_10.333665:2065-1511(-)
MIVQLDLITHFLAKFGQPLLIVDFVDGFDREFEHEVFPLQLGPLGHVFGFLFEIGCHFRDDVIPHVTDGRVQDGPKRTCKLQRVHAERRPFEGPAQNNKQARNNSLGFRQVDLLVKVNHVVVILSFALLVCQKCQRFENGGESIGVLEGDDQLHQIRPKHLFHLWNSSSQQVENVVTHASQLER